MLEFFCVLFCIALLILLILLTVNINMLLGHITRIDHSFDNLAKQLRDLSILLATRPPSIPTSTTPPPPQQPIPQPVPPPPQQPIPQPVPQPPQQPIPQPVPQPPQQTIPQPVPQPPQQTIPQPVPIYPQPVITGQPKAATPPPPSQFEKKLTSLRNWFLYGNAAGTESGESIEKMVATTWLLRAGILVILFTSAFLLKLSIERGLLGPQGRVALSYIVGAILLATGLHKKLRTNYWSLGQALAGIGLGMFYFSSFAMVSMFHLAPPLVGGAVMVVITISAGLLADRLSSLPIAIISLLGGFATPLLLNTASVSLPHLATYLLLLGVGVLWLANRRNWQQLTWMAMLFTYVIFGLYIHLHWRIPGLLDGFFDDIIYRRNPISKLCYDFTTESFAIYQTALVLIFILYSTSVFIHNIRNRIAATPLEIIGLLANATLFSLLSTDAILSIHHNRLALAPLTLGLALYYLAHSLFLQKRNEKQDRNLLLMFYALAGFFLAVTVPAVLTGHWLAPAWALQALMMLWLSYKLDSRFLRGLAWILYAITLERLSTCELSYSNLAASTTHFWRNSLAKCIQFLIPITSLALAAKLTNANSPALSDQPESFSRKIAKFCNFVWPLLLFIHSTRVLQTIINNKLPGLRGGGISVLWAIFAFAFLLKGLKSSLRSLRFLGLGLFAIVVLKVFLLDMQQLDALYRILAFLAFGILLMVSAFIYLKFWQRKSPK